MSSLWSLAKETAAKAVTATKEAGSAALVATKAASAKAVAASVNAVENVAEATRPLTETKEHKEERERERDLREQKENTVRVEEFFKGTLAPYEHANVEDTKLDKTGRVAKWTLNLLEFAGVQYTSVISSIVKVSKFGVAAFVFREDLADLVNVVASFLGSDLKGLSKKDTVVGLYYLMCLRMLERRADPLLEEAAHKEGVQGVLAYEAPEDLLKEFAWIMPFAFLAYAESKAQVQWMANGYGFDLVVSHLPARKLRPAYNLIVSQQQKLAILSVCGTKEIGDIATDSKLLPDAFEAGHCHQGMLTAAKWLIDQGLRTWLQRFRDEGYQIILCGHSLGAGVASLVAYMLRAEYPDVIVYAFAPPCVVSEDLADDPWVRQHIKAFVHRDDIVCRASAANASSFAAEIRATRGQWEPLLSEDYTAFKARVATLWAPARRHPKKTWAAAEPKATLQGQSHPEGSIPDSAGEIVPPGAPIKGVRYVHQGGMEDDEFLAVGEDEGIHVRLPNPPSGLDGHQSHLPSSSEMSHHDSSSSIESALSAGLASTTATATASASPAAKPARPPPPRTGPSVDIVHDVAQPFEAAKIRLVPMGVIVHTYAYQGILKASLVDHTFPEFRKIQLSPHLLENHGKANIIIALRTVMAARRAPNAPPVWASANDDDSSECKVCHLDVTWASTSSSEAQKARAMHHCRACGKIVCHECSLHKAALPTIGMVEPDRICDLCHNRGADLAHMFAK